MPALSERKREILLKIIPVFAEKGFHGAKTRDLADAAGISDALLFRHFSSIKVIKKAMLTLISELTCEAMVRVGIHTESEWVIEKAMLLLIEEVFRVDRVQGILIEDLHRVLLYSLLESPEFARETFENTFGCAIPLLSEALTLRLKKLSSQEASDRLWMVHHLVMGEAIARRAMNSKRRPLSARRKKLIWEGALRLLGFSESDLKKLEKELPFAV